MWTEYQDPRRDPWWALVLPVLGQVPAKQLAAAVGLLERSVKAIRNGHSKPRAQHRVALIRAAADFARARLRAHGTVPPADDLAVCAAHLAASSRVDH